MPPKTSGKAANKAGKASKNIAKTDKKKKRRRKESYAIYIYKVLRPTQTQKLRSWSCSNTNIFSRQKLSRVQRHRDLEILIRTTEHYEFNIQEESKLRRKCKDIQEEKMADIEPTAVVPSTPVKTPKKSAAPKPTKVSKAVKPKVAATHPSYNEMVVKAVVALKERSGSSRQAILKYIMANFQVGNDAKIVNTHMKMALKRGLTNGALKNSKGAGVTGSFKVAEKPKAEKKEKARKVEKPKKAAAEKKTVKKAVAKPKKAAATKKATSPKKTAAKKVIAKPKKVTEKKAAKPKAVAAKTKVVKKAAAAKKPTTPKAAKKPVAKKAAAKK